MARPNFIARRLLLGREPFDDRSFGAPVVNSGFSFSANPIGLLGLIKSRWPLVFEMARRDTLARFKSSWLGAFWLLITPILMLAVYTFAFGEIFKARWSVPGSTSAGANAKSEFALILYAGLIVYGFFSECLSRAPGLIVTNVNLVKKIAFPIELLPVINLLGALFNALVGVLILEVFQLFLLQRIVTTIWVLPIVWLPLILLCLGLSWFLASLGVYVRDTAHSVGVVLTGLMFLSPVFFPASAFPEQWRALVIYNPLVFPIEASRQVLLFNEMPDWSQFGANLLAATVIAWGGYAWFQKTRRGFADVL